MTTATATPTAAPRTAEPIAHTIYDSPIGPLLLAATATGLVRLAYAEGDTEALLEELSARVSPRLVDVPARLDPVRRELDEYFTARRTQFDSPLDWALIGPFARRVLEATARIEYGETATYGELVGGAARAAGNALARNPIAIVIPCHRVVQSSGALGGYGGGMERKRFLLELEGALPSGPSRARRSAH